MDYKGYILSEIKAQKLPNETLEKHNLSIDRLKETEALSTKELKSFLKVIGITEAMVNQKLDHLDNLIVQFTKHLIYVNKEKAEFVYYEINAYEHFLPHTQFNVMAELLKLRYYIAVRKEDKFEDSIKVLNKLSRQMGAVDQFLFKYFQGMIEILQAKYLEADARFEELAKENITLIGFEAEFYYHLSLIKTQIEQASRAIYYGKKALEYATAQFNFKRIILVQMALAVNFSNSKIYEDAAECYDHVLRNAELLGETHMIPHIYHNMADLYFKMEKYSLALAYFKISLQHFDSDDINYLNCLFNIGLTEVKLNKKDEAITSFENLFIISKNREIEKFSLYASYYLIDLKESEEQAIEYLEEVVMPFIFNNPGEKHMDLLFSQILVLHYKEKGNFEKAFQYITDEKYNVE